MGALVLVALVGGFYGFALWVRDYVRAWRRLRAGGVLRMWLPESPELPPPPSADEWWKQ